MISLQKHFHRDELWQLIKGVGLACVRSEDNVVLVHIHRNSIRRKIR